MPRHLGKVASVETDWSVECGADDPWVVLPWTRKDASIHYIDLRVAPDRLREIPEAVQYDCIEQALHRWNQPSSPVYTAKCDVWTYPSDLFDAADLPGHAWAQGSYIDLIPASRRIFASFAAKENLLRAWSTAAKQIPLENARCEWTLRRARILPSSVKTRASLPDAPALDGFATTLYVWGYGSSQRTAREAWAASLTALIETVLLVAAS